tara:strand:- start:786 stop:1415 length:630 start_codon:yes stop_codon:yes gene_type:complete
MWAKNEETMIAPSEVRKNRTGSAPKGWVLIAVVLCGVGLGLIAFRPAAPTEAVRSEDLSPVPGSFGALTFTSLDGGTVSMSQFLGRPMLVEIWATWCAPCVKARKQLHLMADEAERYASLIALSVDRGGTGVVSNYLAGKNEAPTSWVDLMADDPMFRSVIGPHDERATIPKLIFVDARGRIVDIEYGIPNSKWVLNRLKALASAGPRG